MHLEAQITFLLWLYVYNEHFNTIHLIFWVLLDHEGICAFTFEEEAYVSKTSS